MDKYNVIDRIDSLSDLEQDMFEWSRLPMKFKFMADDACMRKHGVKNAEYYQMVKSKLMGNAPYTDIIDDSITESAEDIISGILQNGDRYDHKVTASNKLQESPYIIIITPEDAQDNETLVDKYQSYISLPPKYRRWSDYYSKDIWDYTVPEMYRIASHTYNTYDTPDTIVKRGIDYAACENNIIDLLVYKSLNYVSVDESYRDRWMNDRFIEDAAELDFDSVFNKVTPYFTPDEYNQLSENQLIETLDYQSWKRALREALESKDEQKIIDLGWNPSVPFNEKTQEYARNRQISWFKNNAPKVVDLTKLHNQLVIDDALLETTRFMESLYDEKGLYPVYIVMSYSDTLFGNVERVLKKVEYTHAGLTFNSDLKEIFTFSFGKEYNGFATDSLDIYLRNSKNAIMSIICIFVDKETRNAMHNTLNYLQDHKEKTRYGFGNLVNILLNRAKKFPYPENLAMVCSQFVDMMLKLVNIDITHKSSNLVIPQDFKNIEYKRSNVYKVYEGLCSNYREDRVERLLKILFSKGSIRNIKYPNTPLPIDFVKESDEMMYNTILDEINDLLTPTEILSMNLPVAFNEGDTLDINIYTILDATVDDDIKLLDEYDDSDIEGIKRVIARLFCINLILEEYIRNTKKADAGYESMMHTRDKIKSAFISNLDRITKLEKDFDFAEYYQNSEYNNSYWTTPSMETNRINMKYSGDTIKKVLKKMKSV